MPAITHNYIAFLFIYDSFYSIHAVFHKVSSLKEGDIGLPLEEGKFALLPMGQSLLATRSLRSLDGHRLFALPTMAKQKVLPFPDSGIYASLRRATPYERVFHAGA